MAVPDFQTIMRPLLAEMSDGGDHAITAVRNALAEHFSLTEDDLMEEIPSGRAKTFHNRVGWATTYLYRAGLIERPKRSVYCITARGTQVLADNPERVDLKVLAQFDEFNEFRSSKSTPEPEDAQLVIDASESGQTPEEQIAAAYGQFRSALAADVLDRVLEQSPDFFEQLVLDVLRAMGYGGSSDESAQKLGQSGDQGVDGVIREDELGLDLIYVQAKRWTNPVGRPEIQKFVGALQGPRATKGVFITTSTFSAEARAYADSVTPRVILVDGKKLANLMIDHNVGVTVARAYRVKRIDLDYFATDDDGSPAETQPEPASS